MEYVQDRGAKSFSSIPSCSAKKEDEILLQTAPMGMGGGEAVGEMGGEGVQNPLPDGLCHI